MLRAVDLFCGAGGTTTGAVLSGKVKVVLAINHWRTAIYTHSANHPETRHICARIDHVDPRNDATIPEFDLLLASPECTHHSIARGGQPIDDQKRATPWHVTIWAEAKRPKWIIVENVREFQDWGPVHNGRPIASKKGETFVAWINTLRSLGYTVEWKLLNAADYGEATRRIRLFVIARRGSGAIPWPAPSHVGKWRAAAEVIAWDRPCPSIFGRKRPLADKTLKRIEIGLRKFVGDAAAPFIVKYHGGKDPKRDGTERSHSVSDPLATITTEPRFALATPFLFDVNHGGKDGRCKNVADPMPTVTTKRGVALAAPFLMDIHDRRREDRSSSIKLPVPTIVTKPGNSLVVPFLTKFNGTGGAEPVTVPLSTNTTKPRHGLAIAELQEAMGQLGVVDVGFRMLDVDELAAAQGFPDGYQLTGNKADQIRQIGNSVCPRVMKALCTSVASA